MPEIAECAIFADALNESLAGKYMINCTFDKNFKHLRDLQEIPTPLLLEKVESRGKKIIFSFETGFLVSSLGLEGSWYFDSNKSSTVFTSIWGTPYQDEEFFLLSDVVSYRDTRHFGWLEWFSTSEKLEKRLDLGRDLLKDPPTFTEWKVLFTSLHVRTKEAPIGEFLLRQDHLAGIGNYLRAEILYMAEIHPEKKLKNLTVSDHKRLWNSCITKVKESYEKQGASLRTYTDMRGNKGNFVVEIYGKTTDPLGNAVVQKKDGKGRTIWFVPTVQKM